MKYLIFSIATEQKLAKRITANETFIQQHYPGENFISTTEELRGANRYTERMTLPENVRIAESRTHIKSNEQQRTLKKELWQAGVLSQKGNSVFLTPEYSAYKVRVTDAVVNGFPYEFRNITGQIRKIETRFGNAKEKGDNVNVFLYIDTNVDISEVRRRIGLVLNRHPEYTGKITISIRGNETYFWDTSSFR